MDGRLNGQIDGLRPEGTTNIVFDVRVAFFGGGRWMDG